MMLRASARKGVTWTIPQMSINQETKEGGALVGKVLLQVRDLILEKKNGNFGPKKSSIRQKIWS